ncbi:nuclear transport factor 2 family protein [Pontibacillus sp. HMF3514]|uniref:nuclear transport factor 2 family protein n=1 Tax=Pontibacillus sp. HMF3514 TaxID=2692425 RepID=UPI00131F57EC|nr:nuclear transport factor 2 family protein [Pontibacillus sp. HMF3514]QHE51415.1 DUF4440 domain-containing protein [Pontibacillus sp. HMF3514]
MLQDFKGFLSEYRDSWNSLDAERMAAHNSKGFKAIWANPDSITSEWGYDEAKEGWIQAYQQYQGRSPIWHFEDVLININNHEEGVVVCWVSFELDGKMTDVKLLFTQTFKKENGEWKKIREYVENSFANERLKTCTS